MTELSPQAQEVFWAFNRAASGKPDDWHYLPAIAAALEAVADQVVPEEPMHSFDQRWMYERDTRQSIRSEILTIAAELRGTATQEDN
jgi:hypothetical protein